ncbi:hypothetical protein AAULR_25166, partial [Lacticaseibacillus rhamnosus MTCC 5462]
ELKQKLISYLVNREEHFVAKGNLKSVPIGSIKATLNGAVTERDEPNET